MRSTSRSALAGRDATRPRSVRGTTRPSASQGAIPRRAVAAPRGRRLVGIATIRHVVGAIWLSSIASVIALALAINVGPSFGVELFAIRGGSMAPTIPIGAVVVAVRTAPEAIHVDDVISVRADNGVVFTHRVIEVDASEPDRWLHTKGDANATPDGVAVPVGSVVGVVPFSIPLAGYLVALLGTPSGALSFIAYTLALLLAMWLLEDAEDAEAAEDAAEEADAAAANLRGVTRSRDLADA